MSKSRANMMNPLFRKGFSETAGVLRGESWESARDKLGNCAKPGSGREGAVTGGRDVERLG